MTTGGGRGWRCNVRTGGGCWRAGAGAVPDDGRGNWFPAFVPAIVPAPGSALGARRRSLTSFVRDGAALLDKAEPLAARNGLVLMRVSPSPAAAGGILFSVCVCSLLTGKLDVLPPLDIACLDDEGIRGYVILRLADHGDVPHRPADGYSNLCQVLLIGVYQGNKQLHIHSFSTDAAASRSWSAALADCFPVGLELFAGPYGRVATVCGDTARWLFEDHRTTGVNLYTVDVNVKTGRVCASKIIIQSSLPRRLLDWTYARLCLIDERLSLIYEHENHLIIRTRQDVDKDGTAIRTCAQGILVDAKEFWSPRGLPLTIVCVAEKSGTVLVLSHSKPNHAYLLDLQSKSTTKVADWNGSFDYKTAVPYEMNLPELFVSRLGVQL